MRRAIVAGIAPWDYFGLPTPNLPHIKPPAAAAEPTMEDITSPTVGPAGLTLEQSIQKIKGMSLK